MKIIIHILILVLAAGCSTKVPINGYYDTSFNLRGVEKRAQNMDQEQIDSEFYLFSRYGNKHYDISPTYEAEIEYPRFTFIVVYSDPDSEPRREDWTIKQVDENRYELTYKTWRDTDRKVEFIYDPILEELSSASFTHKKR